MIPRILIFLSVASFWVSCQKRNGNLGRPFSPASDSRVEGTSDSSNVMQKERPYVLDIRRDSVKADSKKISFHTQEIRNFLDVMTNNHLSLEDYKRHFSIHSEYEEICFFRLCCDLTQEPTQADCWKIYKQRNQAQMKYASLFLEMLKGKLSQKIHYKNSTEVEIHFVKATYVDVIRFQSPPQKEMGACTYELKDRNGGKIYIVLNATSGEPATIGRMGDENGVSILGFVEKPPCKR